MSLIEELGRSANEFLNNHPIHVHQGCDDLFKGVHRFTLEPYRGNMVTLRPLEGRGKAIKAHWLPWVSQGQTSMDLTTDETHIFFTSELSGCRITIGRKSKDEVTVAHLAGNHVKGRFGRDRAERDIYGSQRGFSLRRFSQTVDYQDRWAFVVGNYTKVDGWKFIAQINTMGSQKVESIVDSLVVL